VRHERAGFTLIELLVVIAIIGILMAAVRPSITAANDRANTALCESRLAQIHLALRQYVEDRGRLPARLTELVQGHYLLDDSVLLCSRTGRQFAYQPVSPDAPGDPIVASCVPGGLPQGKRPHGQGHSYAYLRLNGRLEVAR
jgi:prepilin-type N-terminal cleavage/methylation domain-containing protein